MATQHTEETLEEYYAHLDGVEEAIQTELGDEYRFGVWLHQVALRLRKLENFFVGTMLSQHAEQFYTICEHDFALQACSEQLRARDQELEQDIRSLRKQIARVARCNEPRERELRQLADRIDQLLGRLREHDLEITKWFDQSLLRLHPSMC